MTEDKIILNSKAWYVRFSTWLFDSEIKDTCMLLRRFIATVAIAGYFAVSPFAPLIAWLAGLSLANIIGCALVGSIAYFMFIWFAAGWLQDKIQATQWYIKRRAAKVEKILADRAKVTLDNTPNQPSALRQALTAFHNKTCKKVSIE